MNDMSCTALRLNDHKLPAAARGVLAMLANLRGGHLTVRLPGGSELYFGDCKAPAATLIVHDFAAFSAVLVRGDVGFGEAYIDGHWDSPELAPLMTLLVRNRKSLAKAICGNWLALFGARLRHRFNANSKFGSRRNIVSHYDLGNDFYAQWLDATMSYSAGLYPSSRTSATGAISIGVATESGEDLALAQLGKYRRILDRLDLRPGQHVLEIGCGWGAFAEIAARDYGLRVTGVTLSPAQLAYAQKRVADAGLSAQVELRLQDYRDLEGVYDAIVSIEMFEAVGEAYWPGYFAKLEALLRPGARALVQTITIDDPLFDQYRKGTDFIQQHVFPGGMLPSKSRFVRSAQAASLTLRDSFSFGDGYRLTLAAWLKRFDSAWPELTAQGFDETFRRLWRFYLAYCEAGFASGQTDVVQFELEKPR